MGMTTNLFNGVEPFKQIVNTLLTEGSMWNLLKIAQSISEKKTFKKIHNSIYVHSPGARADNPQEQNFDCN